jgi:hypothetical protein
MLDAAGLNSGFSTAGSGMHHITNTVSLATDFATQVSSTPTVGWTYFHPGDPITRFTRFDVFRTTTLELFDKIV